QEPHGLFGLTRLPGPAPRVELAQHALEHDKLELGRFVPGPRRLAGLVEAPLDHAQIGERELARDDVVVAYGVDRSHHVHYVGVFEAADHVHDRVDLADVRQELVAEDFRLRGATHQSADVDDLDDGGHALLAPHQPQ